MKQSKLLSVDGILGLNGSNIEETESEVECRWHHFARKEAF